MGGGLHIPPFVPAPSQTLPLLPTPGEAKPTGKSHEFVLLPFMLLSNFEIRGCFSFNFEIDSISETLTNAKTRHDFFLALGLFVVNVECLSGLALGLSGLGSSLVLPCLVYLLLLLLFTTKKNSNLPGREAKLNIQITELCPTILRKKTSMLGPVLN